MYVTTRRAGYRGRKGLVIRRLDGAILGEYPDYRLAEIRAQELNAAIRRAQVELAAVNDAVWAGRR
jgi:hypothetical protein